MSNAVNLPPAGRVQIPVSSTVTSALSYTPLVLEHFLQPRNVGALATSSDVVRGTAGSIAQGVQFSFSAQIEAGRIRAVRQQVYGCPHSIAAASWLSERLLGATYEELGRWSWREAAEALAVPAEKRGRLLVLEDAVRALAKAWAQSL